MVNCYYYIGYDMKTITIYIYFLIYYTFFINTKEIYKKCIGIAPKRVKI